MDKLKKSLRNYPIRRFSGVRSLDMGVLAFQFVHTQIFLSVFVYFGDYDEGCLTPCAFRNLSHVVEIQ